ncbi:MAG: PKD-like family lipoprotein [Prevotella sp.]
MKQFKIFLLAAVLPLLAACYDDQDGNDFDTSMAEVSIVFPNDAYSGALGSTITVDPIITTEIPETDLEYIWEVNGARLRETSNGTKRNYFVPLLNDEDQGKTLHYVCHLDSNIVALNTTYTCRLRVHQKSTGRDFYADSNFTIIIQGLTGLLVLYGDDNTSDVGILEANEFMPASSSLPESPKATMGMYSMNTGTKLQGKGKSIIQPCTQYMWGDDAKNRCRINVMTEKEAVWLDRNDLSLWGPWNDAFYLQGERQVNANKPKRYLVEHDLAYAFDGDDLFINQPWSQFQFLFPTFTPQTVTGAGDKFTFQPCTKFFSTSGGLQIMYYADAVNGDTSRKGFVGSSSNVANTVKDARLLDTKTDNALFNPGDMKADLVHWGVDSRGHVLSILKGTAAHPQYAGKFFFVDLYPKAPAAGETTYQDIPQVMASMDALTDVDNAIAFEFASTQNELYYATANAVYRYGLDGTALTAAQKLCMTDGSVINFSGEVTMMKLLASPGVSTHNTDEVLLVATWNGSASTLYALHLDSMTGNVTAVSEYGKGTVAGWEFGKIYDVNIKSL